MTPEWYKAAAQVRHRNMIQSLPHPNDPNFKERIAALKITNEMMSLASAHDDLQSASLNISTKDVLLKLIDERFNFLESLLQDDLSPTTSYIVVTNKNL